MGSRSRLRAIAIGLAIGWSSGHAVAQTGQLDALHERILTLDGADQTIEAIPIAKEYAAAIEARSGTDNTDYAAALDILVDLHVELGRFAV
jgi:flagellar motor switch/type III secretory pathway protein FliN